MDERRDQQEREAFQRAIDDALSHLEGDPELAERILQRTRPVPRRRMPLRRTVLIAALVLALLLSGAAVAERLGWFSLFAQGPWNAGRYAQLDEASVTVGQTASVDLAKLAIPQAAGDTMTAQLQSATLSLTLDAAYCDGHKLYYAYTLRSSQPLTETMGEGACPESADWTEKWPGKTCQDVYGRRDDAMRSFFAQHAEGWYLVPRLAIGDGADLPDGRWTMILDSAEQRLDSCTIQGFQEVELPEDIPSGGELTFTLRLYYGATLYAQTAQGFARADLSPGAAAEDMTLAFTVPVTGTLRRFTGEVAEENYTAKATLLMSDVDISGQVTLTCPERWLQIDSLPRDERVLYSYQLVADGVVYENLEGSFGTGGGQLMLGLRFDVPEDAKELSLRPVYSDGSMPEEEDIVLAEIGR